MPWKNGQGLTQELAAHRSADDLRTGRFLWRLSIAQVGASSPFSLFPGCDRTILLLEGDGMVLDSGADGRRVLEQKLEPYDFKGEWQTDCRLLGGPCRDFNVITDRGRVASSVTVLSVSARPQMIPVVAHTIALYAVTGILWVRLDPAQPPFQVPSGHTLLIEKADGSGTEHQLVVDAAAAPATGLVVAFSQP